LFSLAEQHFRAGHALPAAHALLCHALTQRLLTTNWQSTIWHRGKPSWNCNQTRNCARAGLPAQGKTNSLLNLHPWLAA